MTGSRSNARAVPSLLGSHHLLHRLPDGHADHGHRERVLSHQPLHDPSGRFGRFGTRVCHSGGLAHRSTVWCACAAASSARLCPSGPVGPGASRGYSAAATAIRRALLAGIAAAVLLGAPAARAQIPVIDATSIAQLAEQLGVETKQLTTLVNSYKQLVQTYNQTVAVYNSLSHLTNVNQVASLLNTPLLRNSLPSSTLLPGTITGVNAPSALGGGWSSSAQTWANFNRVYIPQAQDWQAQQLQRNANYLATVQALAQQNLQSLEQRQQALADIQSQIDGAKDVQAMAAVQARLSAENAYVTGQAAQATNLLILAQAQQAATTQAQQQKGREDIDNTRSYLCAQLNSIGSAVSSACSQSQ